MGTIETLLKVKADASGAVSGLKPLQASLGETAKDAQTTEKALSELGNGHKITLNDQAIETARKEIERLRTTMRQDLSINPNADTKAASKRIAELQKSIKVLDAAHPVVEATVKVDEASTSRLASLSDSLQSFDGGGIPGIGVATSALSKFGGAASAAAIPAAAIGVGMAAWNLGEQAADVETLTSQLDALTKGHGAETLKELQKWAAATPFALEDAAGATRRLVAAGVPLKDIPDYLNDIGNVAAATGTPIDQIAAVFAQMESSGKATFENIQQLADAGLPVWQSLADKVGLPIAQVQKLATEGKLTSDSIDLLRESLNQMYPTAMADQAETFNGQMSSFHDTVDQTQQTLGTLFLPMMTNLANNFNDLGNAALGASGKLGGFDDWLREHSASGGGVADFLAKSIPGMQIFAEKAKDGKKAGKDLGDTTADALAKVQEQLQGATQDAAAFEKQLKAAEDNVKATIEDFGNIGADVRTHVSFIIDSADLEDEIHKAIAGTPKTKTEKGEPSITLPAHLTIGDVPDLSDKQQELFGNIGSFVETQLQEGARRAELNPNFNEDAWFRQVRRKTKGLLIDAGINPKDAERVLRRLFGLPRKVPVNADISAAQKELDALSATPTKPVHVPLVLSPQALDKKDPLMASFTGGGGALPPVTAPVVPAVPPANATAAKETLNAIAVPGRPRVAHISPVVNELSAAAARHALDAIAKDRISTIYVRTVFTNPRNASGGTAPGGGVQSVAPEGLLASAQALTADTRAAAAAPYFAPTTQTAPGQAGAVDHRTTTRLTPRQTPVQVLLDGAVIADRLDLRRSLAAVQSARRTA